MSEFIEVKGGIALKGEVQLSGAKNAVLPLMLASLLTSEKCCFTNVPNLADIGIELNLIEDLGGETFFSDGLAQIQVSRLRGCETSYSLVRALRASFWVFGPLLARGGAARVALPGGDIIGARPVDIHLAALAKMGADISIKHGLVVASAPQGLKAAEIDLRFPSVGATHQIIMAAALTVGTTVIRNAAREPEVEALAAMISSMGAQVEGAGSSTIVIRGRRELGGASVRVIGDRIEAATYLLAAAISSGELTVRGIDPRHLGEFYQVLESLGVRLERGEDFVRLAACGRLRPVSVASGPFPEFATDIQPLLCAALTLADGTSTMAENVYEGRFGHVAELARMGADITVSDRVATIRGVEKLSAAQVEALDIRAGAALVLAALAAEGTSRIYEQHHLRRGYEKLEDKLRAVGADISARIEDADDFMFTGC